MTADRAADVEATRAPVGRRAFIRGGCTVAGMAVAATAVDGLFVTPRRLATSDLAFGAATASAVPPLRLLQLSDLHLHGIGSLERLLLDRIHDSHPDLVVLTGDAIDAPAALSCLDEFLGELPSSPRRLAILGNWEHRCGVDLRSLGRTYERRGVELLVNRSMTIDHHGRRLRVTGLDDLVLGRPDPQAALATATAGDRHLVLVHCPAARDDLGLPPAHAASLVLSGHTHGGQIAPGGAAVWRPPGSGRYVSGWYREGGPPMYVSRGIGTSLVPVRIGSVPELVRIDWRL